MPTKTFALFVLALSLTAVKVEDGDEVGVNVP